MDLMEVTTKVGLNKNMLELNNIDTTNKLQQIKENKHKVRSIDKILKLLVLINPAEEVTLFTYEKHYRKTFL